MAAPQPYSWVRPLSGIHFSWVPQPSSAGCMPSDTKPSTDQELTNTVIVFGFFERWGARFAVWGVGALDADLVRELAPAFAALRVVEFGVGVAGDIEQRLLDEPRYHAGIGATGGDRGRSARALVFCRQQGLAQR